MSLSIDEYALLNGLTGVNGLTQPGAQNVSSAENEKKATDGDSYISSLSQMNEGVALPSDNYNDLARMIKSAAKADKSTNATEYAEAASAAGLTQAGQTEASAAEASAASGTGSDEDETEEAGSVSGAGGSGGSGGGSESSESETETEIVTINGVTYLQTTTTDSEGNETVTRRQIGAAE